MKKSFFLILLLNTFIIRANGTLNELDSLELIITTQKGLEKAESQKKLCVLYYNKAFYEHSLKHAIESLDYYEKNNLFSKAMYMQNTIGAIYERTKQFERAKEHYLKALLGFEKLKDDTGILMVFVNLGVLFTNNNEYDNSENYFLQAIDKAKEIKDTFKLVTAYNNQSYNYFLNEQSEKSIEAIDSGLYYIHLCPKTEQFLLIQIALKFNLAKNFVKLKQYKKAIPILNKLVKQEGKLNLEEITDLYRMLAETYSELGESEKAITYLNKERYFSDSLNKAINDESLMELTIDNELSHKNKEYDKLLEKEEVKLSTQIKANIVLIIIILFLIIGFIVISIIYYKTKAKNKKIVNANLEMLSNQEILTLQLKQTSKKNKDISEVQKNTILKSLNQLFNENEIYKDNTLTLNSLAKKLNTNRNYLSIVLKEISPSGFLDFVNEYRIKKSWKLLSNPEYFHLTIEHISREVGFKSQPTFNKAFKKFTGVTPSFYLKEVKRKFEK